MFSRSNGNSFISSLQNGGKFVKTIKGITKELSNSPLTTFIPQLKQPLERTHNGLEKIDNGLEKTTRIAKEVNSLNYH